MNTVTDTTIPDNTPINSKKRAFHPSFLNFIYQFHGFFTS